MRDTAEATRTAREGLERHLRIDDACRIIAGPGATRRGPGDAGSGG